MNNIVKNTLILTAITVVSGLLLGVVYGMFSIGLATPNIKALLEG